MAKYNRALQKRSILIVFHIGMFFYCPGYRYMGPYKKRPRIHPGRSLFVNKRKRKLLYTKKVM